MRQKTAALGGMRFCASLTWCDALPDEWDAQKHVPPRTEIFSNITATPLQLLANYTKEGDSGQGRQRQDTTGFPDRDCAASFDVQRFSTIDREENRIFSFGY